MPRPTRLNPARAAVILAAVENGTPLKYAAAAAGVTYDALNDWRKRGRDALRDVLDGADPETADYDPDEALATVPEAVRPFAKFYQDMKESEGRCVALLVNDVRRADKWQAQAWLLERRFGADFPRPALPIVGPDGGPLVSIDARALLTDRLDRLAHPTPHAIPATAQEAS